MSVEARGVSPESLYRAVLIGVAVFGLFTFAADFLFGSGVVPFPPLYWIVALAVLSLPLLFSRHLTVDAVGGGLLAWCGFYLVLLVVGYLLSSESEVAYQQLQNGALSLLSLSVLLVIFADPRLHRRAQQAVLCAVLLAVALNAYELFRPRAFGAAFGRSAGLYGNPNIAGAALVLGMILSLPVVSESRRHWFVVIVGTGVALTFSRAAMLGWVVAAAALVSTGEVSVRRLLPAAAAIAVTGAVVALADLGGVGDRLALALEVNRGRLALGADLGFRRDPSLVERVEAVRLAWTSFAEHPILGSGLGSTIEWDFRASTHNIYARHLAEHGILGLLVFPGLVLAAAGRAGQETAGIAVSAAAFLLVWGFFSHNVLDERTILLGVALLACLARRSGLAPDSGTGP